MADHVLLILWFPNLLRLIHHVLVKNQLLLAAQATPHLAAQLSPSTLKLVEKMTPVCREKKEDPFAVRKTTNVILLGLVFMLLASRTPISIVKTVLYSATDVSGVGYIPGFTGDGYVANAILYSTFAVSNFLAPWLISIIGPKYVPLDIFGKEHFAHTNKFTKRCCANNINFD